MTDSGASLIPVQPAPARVFNGRHIERRRRDRSEPGPENVALITTARHRAGEVSAEADEPMEAFVAPPERRLRPVADPTWLPFAAEPRPSVVIDPDPDAGSAGSQSCWRDRAVAAERDAAHSADQLDAARAALTTLASMVAATHASGALSAPAALFGPTVEPTSRLESWRHGLALGCMAGSAVALGLSLVDQVTSAVLVEVVVAAMLAPVGLARLRRGAVSSGGSATTAEA